MSTETVDFLQGKNVLLSGGTGFIGRALVPELLAAGARVTVYTRNPRQAREKLPAGVLVVGDLLSLDSAGYDAVINLAGAPIMASRWTARRKAELLASRIETTELLLEHLRNHARFPSVVVSGSAVGYYGDTGDTEVTEQAAPGAGFAAQLCRLWEESAFGFKSGGARLCLLRTGIVLGPNGGALQKMLLPFKLGLGGPMGSGKQWMSWIHLDDLVAMILSLLISPAMSGPINAVAPKPVSNRCFASTLAQVLHRPSFVTMPAIAVQLLFGQAGRELLLASNRVVPAQALGQNFTFRYSDLTQAISASL
ncbi:TIGR01777 family oxidoreductase [Gilvimarinus agarilyticus]|uniref:TIGR01777 family oxidoreductase n=1 Tax=Gilvimarinus sp. 2_MG-2023 TaxID=3062666 RepID=UPI001C0A0E8B|nr:TIGR01777 family oxidoreductase [Gilvimarinus sp. 2_MG-2023]MBU2885987.1 TIGR01777 family oxidoreductase [Gilvimarinus agarilyticus]MDO6570733.1 TIGR01777 family oxidoreductase [Gilvimarinus sp. 2_MG-2023]